MISLSLNLEIEELLGALSLLAQGHWRMLWKGQVVTKDMFYR